MIIYLILAINPQQGPYFSVFTENLPVRACHLRLNVSRKRSPSPAKVRKLWENIIWIRGRFMRFVDSDPCKTDKSD